MGSLDQHGADVRFDWGSQGLAALVAGGIRTVVIIDVLRFTTAVDVACGRGAAVTPVPADDEVAAAEEATRRGGRAADPTVAGGDTSTPSLSPVSLRNLTGADHIVLPWSGASLAVEAARTGLVVLAGCLRNANAVAGAVNAYPVGIVAAGERWPDGTLRVAVEDAWGAGAIVRALAPPAATDPTMGLFAMFGETLGGAPQPAGTPSRSLSPEAAWTAGNLPTDLTTLLPKTASGRELDEAGWSLDIEVSAALNVSQTVPRLDREGTFRSNG